MRRIAKVVGITPMAVYRHYPDRDALLNALANEGFDELTAQLTAKPLSGNLEDRLVGMLDVFLDHALDHPRLFELMFLQRREGARTFPRDFKAQRSPTANLSVKLLQEGMDRGYLRTDDPWEIAFETGAFWHGLVMLHLGGRTPMSRDEFRALCHRSFRRYLNGIRT